MHAGTTREEITRDFSQNAPFVKFSAVVQLFNNLRDTLWNFVPLCFLEHFYNFGICLQVCVHQLKTRTQVMSLTPSLINSKLISPTSTPRHENKFLSKRFPFHQSGCLRVSEAFFQSAPGWRSVMS